MNAEQLKASLLQQAIEGKLVPQLDEEPPVAQIGEPPKDVSFAIPEKWKWVKMNNFVEVIQGTSYKSGDVSTSGIRVIRGGNLNDSFRITFKDDDVFLPESFANKKQVVSEHDIVVVASTGSLDVIGRPASVSISDRNKCQIGAFLRIVRPKNVSMSDYLKVIFKSALYRDGIKGLVKGTNIRNIKKEYILDMYIPVPPIEEQRRIVEKLNALLPLVEEYGKAYDRLTRINKEFPSQLKASLLQQAIEGKLVPQLDEEPSVAQIGDPPKDVPFAIPEKWKWVKLSSVGKIVGGGTPKTAIAEYWGGKVPWITPADLGKNKSKRISVGSKSITELGLNESSAKLMPKGSVIYSSRAPIGYVAIADNSLCTNQGCKSLVPDANFIDTEYAYFCLIARTDDIKARASGTTFKEISGREMGETAVPLPPIVEQRRIVEKLNALLPLVDEMTA